MTTLLCIILGAFIGIVIYFIAGYILFPLYSVLKESFRGEGHLFSFEAYKNLLTGSSAEAVINSILLSDLYLGAGMYLFIILNYYYVRRNRYRRILLKYNV